MRNPDHLIIKFALAVLVTFMIHSKLVKWFWKFDAGEAVEIASNLSWTFSDEADDD